MSKKTVTTDSKIKIEMEYLRKELYKKYPAHHSAHVQIFSIFWGLHSLLREEGGLTNE